MPVIVTREDADKARAALRRMSPAQLDQAHKGAVASKDEQLITLCLLEQYRRDLDF